MPREDDIKEDSGGLLANALFNSIGDGAIATDEYGNITRVNATALRILGYTEKQLLGKWFPAQIVALREDGSEVPYIDRSITKAFLTGRPVVEKTYYADKNHHKIPVSVTVSPMILYHRPIGAINLFRDITQEYEIDRMKSEFISLASHQLRTPLTTIKTYSHMLEEGYMGQLVGEQRAALDTIIEAADKMNQLTNTLLNIARIESGFMTVAQKATNIVKLVSNIIKEQVMAAREKNIELIFRTPKTCPKVLTDSFIVEEVLSNLITNAIKYTPEGGRVTIAIKTSKTKLVCKVTDTGIGIPKQAQKQIFSKFYRAPNVHSRDTTGSGLGLYLVKEMADRLGAGIWFDSHVGKGSTFYFSLPIQDTAKTELEHSTHLRAKSVLNSEAAQA